MKPKITITLEKIWLDKIRKQAAIEGRTVSNMIQRLVELAFAKKAR